MQDDLHAPSPAVGGEDVPKDVGSPSAKKEPPDAEQPDASKQDPEKIATAEKRLSDLQSQLDQISQYGGDSMLVERLSVTKRAASVHGILLLQRGMILLTIKNKLKSHGWRQSEQRSRNR